MNKDIERILADLRLTGERYAKPTRYYDGDHDLAFATQKFENAFGTLFREFALNLCPVICDAVRDKLRVTGFSVDSIAGKAHDVSAGSRHSDTRRIWHTNRMDTRAGEVHKEALKNGDAYIIMWPNARGEAVFYPNRAANMSVTYDEDSPGLIQRAAKHWLDADKHVRLNLFYPDRIEKYISRGKSEGAMPDAKDFVPLASPKAQVKVQSRDAENLGHWTWDIGLFPILSASCLSFILPTTRTSDSLGVRSLRRLFRCRTA
ncbi:MAG: phage portal protein [Chloracidobacterium sp.]|nr:phage portal protein [Chloracidobacterium sp.]